MLWKTLICVIAVVAGIAVFVHHAMTKTQVSAVADVRAIGNPGGAVALQGKVTYAEDNTFVLDDDTGKVEVTTCPVWYKRVGICVGERVMVVGRVLTGIAPSTRSDFVIGAYRIFRRYEVIEIRAKPGKPPWGSQRASGEPLPSP